MASAVEPDRARAHSWLSIAAAVTWAALAVLTVRIATADPVLSITGRVVGTGLVTLVIGIGAAHLVLRASQRRVPWRWWSLAAQTVGALLAILIMREPTFAIFLIVLVHVVNEAGNTHQTTTWLTVANLCLLATLLALQRPMSATVSWTLFVGFQVFALVMSRSLAGERNAREQLAGVNAELLATRRLLQESARSQERLRISRELHDVAGHRLTALTLNLEAMLGTDHHDPERLSLCRDLSRELLDDIRAVVHQLRRENRIDVAAALEHLRHQHPGLIVHLNIDEDLQVDHVEVAEALIRSSQEAITNAVTHGRAPAIWIELRQRESKLILRIRDNGHGGTRRLSGSGLRGMSERAELLGGKLAVDPVQVDGWHLTLSLPSAATP
ncbi:MAG: sensor histidine kinase [Myxococcota bacterium]